MHKLICSRCLLHVKVLPPLSHKRISCSHVLPHSRWFALYEDVTPVDIPISELPPSSSSYTHEAPIGLNTQSSTTFRRSASSSYVPTLVDASELGGRDIVDEDAIGSVLGTSTGGPSTSLYDFDSLLATVEESNLELPKLDIVPSRDLLPPSILRGSSPLRKAARKTSTEKEQTERLSSRGMGVRSRYLSSLPAVSSISKAASIIVPKMEEEVNTVQIMPAITHVIPESPIRDGEMNIQRLLDITNRSDMSGLRSLLAESFWPKAKLSPYQVSDIFTLVIEKARDCEECREIIRDFACTSSRHSLPSHIPILLAARSAREEGIQRALEALQFHHKAFIMASISLEIHFPHRVSAVRSLWKEVAKKSEKEDVFEMHEKGVKMGLLNGTKELMEETLEERRRSGSSFSSIFREWKEMGERYGTRHYGLGTVVRAAMETEGELRRESLTTVSSFVATSPYLRIESFVAYLVLNLLSRGEEKAAKRVFSLVFVHGDHWKDILKEIERDQCAENLVLIEKIANLITYGAIGEIRKMKKTKKEMETTIEEATAMEENKEEVKDELIVIMEEIVWRANGGKNERRKKGFKKEKKKRVKVDQKEIHELAEQIQKSWLNMENAINGSSSEGMIRLSTWSMLHRLAIPESIAHLISFNEKKTIKRESGV